MAESFELLRNFVSYRTRGLGNLRRVETILKRLNRENLKLNRQLLRTSRLLSGMNSRGLGRAAQQMNRIARDSAVAARNARRFGGGVGGGGRGGGGGGRGGGGGGFFAGGRGAVRGLATFFGAREAGRLATDTVRTAANFEKISISLRAIVGNEPQFNRLISDLERLALGTTTNLFEDLLPSAQLLLGSGFEAGQIPDLLRQLADLSALSGENLFDLASTVGRNRLQFRLLTRDVREFTNRGINVIPSLARQLDLKGATEVFKAVEDGKVTINNLLVAINELTSEGGQAFGLQAELLDTFAGQAERAREEITRLKTAIGTLALPAVTAAAQGTANIAGILNDQTAGRPTRPISGPLTGQNASTLRQTLALLVSLRGLIGGQFAAATGETAEVRAAGEARRNQAAQNAFGIFPGQFPIAGLPESVRQRQRAERLLRDDPSQLGPQEGIIRAAGDAIAGAVGNALQGRLEALQQGAGAAGRGLAAPPNAVESALLGELRGFNRAVSSAAIFFNRLPQTLGTLNKTLIDLRTEFQNGTILRIEETP